MKHASLKADFKKYFGLAHTFLLHNKLLVFLYFLFFTSITVTPYFYKTQFDVFRILSIINFIGFYFLIKYDFLLPKVINESTHKHRISKKQLISLHTSENWKIVKFVLVILFPYLLVLLLFYALISIVFGNVFLNADQTSFGLNSEVGFYPREVINMFITSLFFAPLYIIPILYFVKNLSLKQSFKEGLLFTIKHKQFILPAAALWGVYWAVSYLFIHQANYFAMPFRIIIESYLGLLITVAIYYYYRDHAPKSNG